MTLLVSWMGIDTHGIGSAYIVTDSRISWQNDNHFDYARKVFTFNNFPDIIGYCGDVLFPSIVLGQIVEMVDCGLLIKGNFTCKEKFEVIKNKMIQSFTRYPSEVKSITSDCLQVLHISKDTKTNLDYLCHIIEWRRKRGWRGKVLTIPKTSGLLCTLGSGSDEFLENYKRYKVGPNKNTSRNIFHCFCDILYNSKDKTIGGAPQLVGIYRKPNSVGKKFGIIHKRQRYLFGMQVDNIESINSIEWRNSFFEICDGATKMRLSSAMKQPDPLRRH